MNKEKEIKIVNLSNHPWEIDMVLNASKSFNGEVLVLPQEILTDWGQMTPDNYVAICDEILEWIKLNGVTHIHLAGFQPAIVYLAVRLSQLNVYTFYSYTKRVAQEVKGPQGESIKTSVFKFEGFFEFKL